MAWMPLLCGCAYFGLESPYTRDPLTGGINANTSQLLNIPLPPGLQSFPSHSGISRNPDGSMEGLETFRGHFSENLASQTLFNTLKLHGWQLRLALSKGDRSFCIYQNGSRLAALNFHKQGILTILEIWAGAALPDGASLTVPDQINHDTFGQNEAAEIPPLPGTVETWGTPLEENEL